MLRRAHIPLLLVALLLPAASAGGKSEGQLRHAIGAGKAQERTLAGAATRLGRLEAATQREVTILQGRVAAAQSDLDAAQAAQARTATALAAARARVSRLRVRLVEVRARLGEVLRSSYMGDQPDLITVVLDAHGFEQLLETVSFLQTVQRRDTEILDLVRSARRDAGHEQRVLAVLEARRRAQEIGRASCRERV